MMKVTHLILLIITKVISFAPDYQEFTLKTNENDLPIFQFCRGYQLLIDTGSEQLWIADHYCKNCKKTLNICPHIKQLKHQISYFKGSVRGDFISLNFCHASTKVFCVKQSNQFQMLNANGIIGIKGNSTGKTFLKNYIDKLNISHHSLALYFGKKQFKLIFGNIPKKYIKQLLYQQIKNSWNLEIVSFSYNNSNKFQSRSLAFFDTGSNLIVLEANMFQYVQKELSKQLILQNCHQIQPFGVQFKCYSKRPNLNVNISFEIQIIQDKNISININLMNIVTIKDQIYSFKLQKSNQNKIILGIPAFKNYIIQFGIDDTLRIFQSNSQQLKKIEEQNYRALFCQYIILIALLSLIGIKIQQLIRETINKKIVI